ncbi:hypothetical protein GGR50DRAFT_84711 [Xylaria sp. CBS 124048]|nr:hypothetical protein GGR50DRAFT_84711 [Xylaria sp. CBS 124048]
MAPITPGDDLGRPLSVKEISDRAQFTWNDKIPFKNWVGTAQTLQQEADMYLRDGNFSQAYVLYLRYTTLVLELLKTHPEAKTPEAKKTIRSKVLTIDVTIKHLERLKPILHKRYEEWLSTQPASTQAKLNQQQDSPEALESPTYNDHASKDPALSYAGHLLDAGKHKDLAVELARKEIQRRDRERKAADENNSITNEERRGRRTADFWDNWSQGIADRQAADEEVFRKQMESTRKALNIEPKESSVPLKTTTDHLPKALSYPKITKSTPVEYDFTSRQPNDSPIAAPVRPPKQQISDSPLPARPPKLNEPQPEVVNKQPEPHQEVIKKQHGVAFKPAAYLENGEPIRPVFLPTQLRHRFVELASENTRRGLEMCGMLCGTAVNNALFVQCLLIPEQTCTADTCETVNEGSMLEYCIEEDLLMLGWIHTHPTQTCFMSSRDMHTHAGYQIMLPESIAIVCSPQFEPSYGIFRLTNPPGLHHILECTQSATFHGHDVEDIYTSAENPPGHVFEHHNIDFYVHDIRPGARNGTGLNKRV